MTKWIIFIFLFAESAFAESWMSETAMALAFKGTTLIGEYDDGRTFTETYALDGTIKYQDISGRFDGTWSVVSGKFCTFYWGLIGGCFVAHQVGENCFEFLLQLDNSKPQTIFNTRHWVARAWKPNEKKTCTDMAV
jgi:hypothetical protein